MRTAQSNEQPLREAIDELVSQALAEDSLCHLVGLYLHPKDACYALPFWQMAASVQDAKTGIRFYGREAVRRATVVLGVIPRGQRRIKDNIIYSRVPFSPEATRNATIEEMQQNEQPGPSEDDDDFDESGSYGGLGPVG